MFNVLVKPMFQARLKLGSLSKHWWSKNKNIDHQPPSSLQPLTIENFLVWLELIEPLKDGSIPQLQYHLSHSGLFNKRWGHFSWTKPVWNLISSHSDFSFLIEIRESCGKHHSDVHHFLEDNYLKKSLTHFDFLQPQNVSAILGKTAFLTCVVKNLKPTQKVEYLKILTPLIYTGNILGVLGATSWCPYSDSRRADLHIRREILL